MLVLSRKKNESIVISKDVTVTVVEIRGDKVRLGIVAPKEVPVHRQEVFDAIHGIAGEPMVGRRSIPDVAELNFEQLVNEIDEGGYDFTAQEAKGIMDDVMAWVSQQWGDSSQSQSGRVRWWQFWRW